MPIAGSDIRAGNPHSAVPVTQKARASAASGIFRFCRVGRLRSVFMGVVGFAAATQLPTVGSPYISNVAGLKRVSNGNFAMVHGKSKATQTTVVSQ